MVKSKRRNTFIAPLLFGLALLILWQIASERAWIGFWVLPSPKDVVNVFIQQPQLIWTHLKPTLYASLVGLLIAFVLGIICAILMHGFTWFKNMIYPYLVLSQTVPVIAIAPLLVLWFGFGIASKVFTVTLSCFFPISLGFFDGLKQVPMEQIQLLKSMGASKLDTYRLLMIPAALPSLFTGLKLAATYSVMGAVFGEYLGGNAGLGIYMTRATKSFQTAHVFAVIITISALSMALFGVVALLDRLFLSWNYRKQAEYEDPA